MFNKKLKEDISNMNNRVTALSEALTNGHENTAASIDRIINDMSDIKTEFDAKITALETSLALFIVGNAAPSHKDTGKKPKSAEKKKKS